MACELDIVPVLRHYGWQEVDGSGWVTTLCCFHHETRPSARVNLEENAFVCHGCQMRGNTVTLLMKREEIDYQAAIRLYEEITGRAPGTLRAAVSRESGGAVPTRPRPFERDSPLLQARVQRGSPPRRPPRL